MAGEAWPIDASSGAPSYTAAELRGIDSVLLFNGTADAFGTRGGGRPGAGMVVTASALAWSVTPGAFVAYPRFSAAQGPYRVTFQNTEAGAYNAPHASFSRRDILSVVIDDAGAGDGSGARQARVVYTAGTASATPASPSVPARGTLLATITVPPSGSPTVIAGPLAVAAGGILPIATLTEAQALTSNEGQYFDLADVDRLMRHTGAAVDAPFKVRQELAGVNNSTGQVAAGNATTVISGTVPTLTLAVPAMVEIEISLSVITSSATDTIAGYLRIREGTTVLHGAGLGFRFHNQGKGASVLPMRTSAKVNAAAGSHTYNFAMVTDAASLGFNMYELNYTIRELG